MTTDARKSTVVWFEIPVTDLGRATAFYESIFDTKLIADARFPTMTIFPYERPGVSGCLMSNGLKPSTDGSLVYLNCDGKLDSVLERAAAAGTQILEGKNALPENMGWVAQIADLDGNRVGLHAAW